MKRLPLSLVGLALSACLAAPAGAAPTECPDKFAGGAAPDVVNPKLLQRTQSLCFSAFAVLHSGAVRTSLWSAERLTRDGLRRARETGAAGTAVADRPAKSGAARPAKSADKPKSDNIFKRLRKFLREVVAELRKVIWPNRKQMITYTTVVLVFVVFMVAFIGGIDVAFIKGVNWLFG